MSQTPPKYRADPRLWEDKDWLYEQYWSQFKSARAIAEDLDVSSRTIIDQLTDYGIPRRGNDWHRDNNVSAFSGFYGDERAPMDPVTTVEHGDPFEEWHTVVDHEAAMQTDTSYPWTP